MRKRRAPPEFSLSFLDVICCGFGAVILLLMITKTVQPQVIEQALVNAEAAVADLTEQLFEIRGETTILNRDLAVKREQVSDYEARIAILQGALARTRSEYDALNTSQNANAIEREQLAIAKQRLSEEELRLLGRNAEKKNQLIGGIPVDSEYVIFVIDTSGSMQGYAWKRLVREVENILQVYPVVKGIQVLSDNGRSIFRNRQNDWLEDTQGERQQILDRLRNWYVDSNSSPVEGIETAITDFSLTDPDKKISIYVFGDDLSHNGAIDRVAMTVKGLNTGEDNLRRVRIHAVGFPQVLIHSFNPESGERFATLMRVLANENGGAFVGLNNYE